jgi:DNA repair exonuclease SbcCD ATPase subunit
LCRKVTFGEKGHIRLEWRSWRTTFTRYALRFLRPPHADVSLFIQVKAGKSSWMKGDEKMQRIRSMHTKILNNVGQVQDRTARILQEQERDLLRAFRARLFDVQTELEKEKNKTDDGASAWIEKSRQLEAEVDWAKEMADRLDRVNQALARENSRLKTQFKTQEDDREFLIKQLVAVKKDNARMRQEYEKVSASMDAAAQAESEGHKLPHVSSAPNVSRGASSRGVHDPAAQHESDNRYKEIIKRLKRLLEVERRNLKQVRTQYTTDLQSRTELELFLKQCVEDVRTDIAKQQDELGEGDLQSFGAQDRERVMELLLSQERVITLLYSKTFPLQSKGDFPGSSAPEQVEGIGGT